MTKRQLFNDEKKAISLSLIRLIKEKEGYEGEMKIIGFKVDFELEYHYRKQLEEMTKRFKANETELSYVSKKIEVLKDQMKNGVEVIDTIKEVEKIIKKED